MVVKDVFRCRLFVVISLPLDRVAVFMVSIRDIVVVS